MIDFRKIDKVELHRHLDGSVRLNTIIDLAKKYKIDFGKDVDVNDPDFNKKAQVLKPMNSLQEVLDCFWILQKSLINYDAIKRVAFENVEDCFNDGISQVELRFAPTFIAEGKKLPYDEIIEAVIDGVNEGIKKYSIKVGLIHIIPRALSLKNSQAATDEVLKFKKGKGKDLIVGVDFADGEDFESIDQYISVTELAKNNGLGVTVHSGENTSAKHIEKTINLLKPNRIGHGIKVVEDLNVVDLALRNDIHFEVCPTSNWLTKCVDRLESHPIKKMLDLGLSVGLNSDDPHLMNIDLTHEYEVCAEHLKMKLSDFTTMNKFSRDASFFNL
ncbi:MAG: adenosine deaminase [Halobacteriovoraceae bacterium]|nr:adenosine deaminase [Halobacteriovoraceae bacterium]|tara:strand:- start:233 stop:1222 length:990 start_codon:yes stop_codon:yes gene_type:complete